MSDRLCVVMPVYNEQDAIPTVLVKWDDALAALGIDYEIRPYNDGSKDSSLDVMRAVAAGRPRISVRNKQNGGHGNTILTGYREAAADGFDWIFQIDSDDEMGPEKFEDLWSARNDADFLVGIRDGRRQALPRKIMSFVSRLCVRIFYGKSVWDVNTPYRLMRASAFRDFFDNISLTTFAPNVILSGLAAGLRCREFRVPQHDRTTGEVSIKKWKLLKAAAKSFWQTIWFAVGGGVQSFGCRILRLACSVTCLTGLAFAILTVANSTLAFWSALVAALIIVCKKFDRIRRSVCSALAWIERRWLLSLCLIALAGLAMRGMGYAINPDLSSYHVTGDAPGFWACAKAMAAGNFPGFKSWGAPGVYALAIKIFGDGLWVGVYVNVFLQLATSVILFVFASRIFRSRTAGVLAFAGYFCAPFFAQFAFQTYGEHLYFLLLALSVLLLDMWRTSRSAALSAVLAVVVAITLYTRSEGGILLLVIAPGLFLATALSERRAVAKAAFSLAVFMAIVGCAMFAGWKMNAKYHGTHCVLCSHDGWWPRLYGTNLESKGRWWKPDVGKDVPVGSAAVGQAKHRSRKVSNGDKNLICKRYEAETGTPIDCENWYCPEELIPLIQKEISRRWSAMDWKTKVKFVQRKERDVWAVTHINGFMFKGRGLKSLAERSDRVFHCILAVAAFLFALRAFRRLPHVDGQGDGLLHVLFASIPFIFCIGMVCVIAIAENNSRYGLVSSLLLTPYLMSLSGSHKPQVRSPGDQRKGATS